jgi:hypothetical protein
MPFKTEQLQIRVTPEQKEELKRRAATAGQDVSSYVLSRVLPPARQRFEELVTLAGDGSSEPRFALAELNDLLSALGPSELGMAVEQADLSSSSPFLQNYVAALVEQACYRKGVTAPAWTADIAPLVSPYFASPLKSHRLHLLKAAPVPYKRRNLFVDAGVGDRV